MARHLRQAAVQRNDPAIRQGRRETSVGGDSLDDGPAPESLPRRPFRCGVPGRGGDCYDKGPKLFAEWTMIDHISVAVADLQKSARFYERVLAPLGLTRLVVRERTIGFGKRYPEFWLNHRPALTPVAADTGVHIALRAPSQDAVTAFHEAALANGGRDDGAPGDRKGEMTVYFGAFIRDPDGNKIEAVTFPKED